MHLKFTDTYKKVSENAINFLKLKMKMTWEVMMTHKTKILAFDNQDQTQDRLTLILAVT